MQFTSNELYMLINLHPSDRPLWLHNANLEQAYLTREARADLREADLSGANLTGACLRWANLAGADLSGASLTNTKLKGANLLNAQVTGEQLAQAERLDGATMPDGTIHP